MSRLCRATRGLFVFWGKSVEYWISINTIKNAKSSYLAIEDDLVVMARRYRMQHGHGGARCSWGGAGLGGRK